METSGGETTLLNRILSERLRVRQDLELVTGSDGVTLLYDPAARTYVRLGRQMAKLLSAFDGRRSGNEIVRELSSRWKVSEDTLQLRLGATLKDLAEAGVFEGYEPPLESNRADMAAKVGRLWMKKRQLLSEAAVGRLLGPLLAVLRPLPSGLPSFLGGSCALLGLALCVFTISQLGVPTVFGWPALLAAVLMIVQTFLHETAHALACLRYGIPVRSLGVALWYWFLPIAYVDRTDAYRLVERRPRAVISLAGPATDMIVAGVAALVAWSSYGLAGDVARIFVLFELIVLAFNLNPLLPTDGQQTLEVLTGEVNLRNRAMRYLGHRLFRAPLPSYLMGASRRRRVVYAAYGALSVLYLVGIAVYLTLYFFGFTPVVRGPVG